MCLLCSLLNTRTHIRYETIERRIKLSLRIHTTEQQHHTTLHHRSIQSKCKHAHAQRAVVFETLRLYTFLCSSLFSLCECSLSFGELSAHKKNAVYIVFEMLFTFGHNLHMYAICTIIAGLRKSGSSLSFRTITRDDTNLMSN